MTLLSLQKVSISFGGPKLLDEVSLQIERGEKACLLGRNGEGKSTLLKLINGELVPDSGDISRQKGLCTAYLSQEIPRELDGTVFEIVIDGLKEVDRSHAKLDDVHDWERRHQVEKVISLMELDANTEFNSDAVSQLLKHFGDDSKVDAVCGELDLYAEASGENLDSAYWQYERVLKFNESKISGLLGANGAIYAIRKNCFKAISPDTIVDDFTIVFQVAVDGGKVIYAPEAVAREEVAPSSADEYKRRVRIGAGNFQAFRRFSKVLSPSFGSRWFTYISHKVLRWHGPHLLLLAFISSLLLSRTAIYSGLKP